jgi:hypothetical protein
MCIRNASSYKLFIPLNCNILEIPTKEFLLNQSYILQGTFSLHRSPYIVWIDYPLKVCGFHMWNLVILGRLL